MKDIIKKRNIHVTGMTGSSCERRIILGLSQFKGIHKVLARKSGRVYVEYDLLKIRGYIGISLIGRTTYWTRVKE